MMPTESQAVESEARGTISYVKMEHDIENQLCNLSVLSKNRCIYGVPERLRQVNEKAYTPQVVSIGPLHHGNKSLKAMEKHKLRYLHHFLKRNKVGLSEYIQKIQDKEKRLQGFYAEPIDKDEFVRIVSVDAAFVIDLLLRFHYLDYRKEEDDYIFSNPTMIDDVFRDLKLLENQLPFFILQDLFTLIPALHHQYSSLLDISYNLFQAEIDSEGKKEKFEEIRSSGVEVKHFVDLIRILYLPLEPEKKPKARATPKTTDIPKTTDKPNITATPNVTELLQAGVKFEVGTGSSLLDIQFSGGILKIPKFRVDDTTEMKLRNLLAFEQCHHREEDYLANYVFLMKRLVKGSMDVQLLVEKGIIDNWLGDTRKISTLLHDLGTGMKVDDWYYAPLCKRLTEYSIVSWRQWMVILKQDYFNTPWAFMSVAAAVILLGLTVVQTVYSIKSVP